MLSSRAYMGLVMIGPPAHSVAPRGRFDADPPLLGGDGPDVAAWGHGSARDAAGHSHARQAGAGAPRRRGPALRTEVGRLPLYRLSGRFRGGARQPERAPPHPV